LTIAVVSANATDVKYKKASNEKRDLIGILDTSGNNGQE